MMRLPLNVVRPPQSLRLAIICWPRSLILISAEALWNNRFFTASKLIPPLPVSTPAGRVEPVSRWRGGAGHDGLEGLGGVIIEARKAFCDGFLVQCSTVKDPSGVGLKIVTALAANPLVTVIAP